MPQRRVQFPIITLRYDLFTTQNYALRHKTPSKQSRSKWFAGNLFFGQFPNCCSIIDNDDRIQQDIMFADVQIDGMD